jgi:serine/threonine protein kinase
MPAAAAGSPGEILLDKYRVEDVIGVGGMGRVVRARHMYLETPVAIKLLLPQMAESPSTVARFLREAQATVRLRSEHIARVMDVGTITDGTPVIVMEFLDGFDLNQILRHHGPQHAQPVVDLLLQACEGLAEAHSIGIIHRDIKPSNFFITQRPDGSNLLKILDFGISSAGGFESELTGTQTVVGTPTYMAPEQMRTARSTDPRSDIWSMGVVMYQMLAGRPPFEAESYAELVLKVNGDPPAPLNLNLPPGLEHIVMRCLEKDPRNRFQTVGELARMIGPYASDPISAAHSAERSTRILARDTRANHLSLSAGQMGSGASTPSALTPQSWQHTGHSSVGGAAGQMATLGQSTKMVHGRRGFVIGVVAVLVVAAGAVGFGLSSSMGKSATHVGAANPLERTMATDTVPKPEAKPIEQAAVVPAIATPKPAPKPDPIPAPTPEIKTQPAADTAKTTTVKTTAVKTTAVKTTAKTVTAKSTTTTTKKKPKDDGLFDDRH